MTRAQGVLPFGKLLPNKETILDWAQQYIERDVKPKLGKPKRERVSSLLIPPGDCIHFYRDGVGYSGVFTPCDFFGSVDVSRTLVDDHLVVPGYHRALVGIVRDKENDYRVSLTEVAVPLSSIHSISQQLFFFWLLQFDFPHDITAIPV